VIQKVYEVRNQIQGNISEEERKAIKALVFLEDDNVSSNPDFSDVAKNITLPLSTVDLAPIYSGCEGVSQANAMDCFKTKVTDFILSEFDKSTCKSLGITEEREMFILFRCDNTGKVTNVKVREQNSELTAKLERVLKSIPPVVPAKIEGVSIAFVWEDTLLQSLKDLLNVLLLDKKGSRMAALKEFVLVSIPYIIVL
jgi:hypothetical protein